MAIAVNGRKRVNRLKSNNSCKKVVFAKVLFTCTCKFKLRPKFKKNVFMVTRPYLNLLVRPRTFFRFSQKYIILCILKGEMPFKMHKTIFFPEKKYIVCVPSYLKFSDLLPETRLFFDFGLIAQKTKEKFKNKMGLDVRNPVFRICARVRLKSACSAAEAS